MYLGQRRDLIGRAHVTFSLSRQDNESLTFYMAARKTWRVICLADKLSPFSEAEKGEEMYVP
ncbi:hypothetical protein KSX_69590 [Ktedonospora formicarum]|uniref:Uncharacterized protein n=1 Tax=Ktedonospora formicarum TaxID=2778364 RepID=A0A8J3I7C7_9CHLR|nr:hypothetical protein KSX_69590 [Ktedonospora formicarum]